MTWDYAYWRAWAALMAWAGRGPENADPPRWQRVWARWEAKHR
jgi:hypothetical protein